MSVTFDDGDQTVFNVALPVLQRVGIRATLYVTVDYVIRGCLYRDNPQPQAMSWDQVRDWVAMGHEVGSHGLTHAPLNLCSQARFDQEVRDSKAILEDTISRPVLHFSYPWGQYNQRTVQRLRDLGLYQTAATSDRGAMAPGHDRLRIKRDLVDPGMSALQVESIMKIADRFYWLRHLRRQTKGYWDQHPEISWDETCTVSDQVRRDVK